MPKRSKLYRFLFPVRFITENMQEKHKKQMKNLYNQAYYLKHYDECKARRKEYYARTGK